MQLTRFLLLICLFPVIAVAADVTKHQMWSPDDVQWSDSPIPGVKMSVLVGDPSMESPFTMRLWLPDATKIPPHWHPAVEHVTVVSGTLHLGLGEKFDESKMQAMNAGSFGVMPAKTPHFGMVKGDTVLQLHGIGPWKIVYVNPADDPANKPK